MAATRTVALTLDGLHVADADVVEVTGAADWLAADALRTANASPHVFGLQRECVRRLAETASARDDGTAAALAHALGQEGARLHRVAETLLEDVPPDELLDDRLAVRASSLELAVRSATALVAATGGARCRSTRRRSAWSAKPSSTSCRRRRRRCARPSCSCGATPVRDLLVVVLEVSAVAGAGRASPRSTARVRCCARPSSSAATTSPPTPRPS